jgi:hypothetical protein
VKEIRDPVAPGHSKLVESHAGMHLWRVPRGSSMFWLITHDCGTIKHDAPLVGGYAGNYPRKRDAMQAWSFLVQSNLDRTT